MEEQALELAVIAGRRGGAGGRRGGHISVSAPPPAANPRRASAVRRRVSSAAPRPRLIFAATPSLDASRPGDDLASPLASARTRPTPPPWPSTGASCYCEPATEQSAAAKPIRCRAAVSKAPGQPLEMEEVEVGAAAGAPGPCLIICTSLCHTDVTFWSKKAKVCTRKKAVCC